MSRRNLDLLREVLDHEIVDADGVSCGRVDDIELAHPPDKGPVVKALLVGPGAWIPRMPVVCRWLFEKVFGRAIVRVPWEEIAHVAETIQLHSKASSLGLGRIDRKVGAWLSRLPAS
jgi:sporulation protein YlmC with PRC-barrel domain